MPSIDRFAPLADGASPTSPGPPGSPDDTAVARTLLSPHISRFWDDLVSCHGDLERLLGLISSRAAEAVGEASALTILSPDGQTLELVAGHHPDPELRRCMRDVLEAEPYRVGIGIAGMAAATGEPVRLSHFSRQEAASLVAPAWRSFVDRYPVHAIVVVPLHAYGEVLGTLSVFRIHSHDPYTDDELLVLEALAERAALALAEADGTRRRLSLTDLRAIFDHSLDGVLFTVPDGRILAANPAACDILQMSEGEIIRRGRGGVLPADDPRVRAAVAQRAISGRARAELPMVRGDHSTFMADLSSTVFTTPDGELRACVVFRDITDLVDWRTQVEEQREALARLAEQDELTGLLNRRGFSTSARRTLAFADRDLAVVQLIYCDLDGLKSINDQHGHRAGDQVITTFAAALLDSVRETDTAARLGGDEFVLLLYAATEEDAERVLGRIREHVQRAGSEVPVSFSAGRVERLPGAATELDRLLEEADGAMYEQKGHRRTPAPPNAGEPDERTADLRRWPSRAGTGKLHGDEHLV